MVVRRLAGRLGEYGIVLAAAVVINFAIPRALPGSPLRTFGEDAGALPEETQARLLAEYGLDQSPWQQFLDYAGGLARLDLGRSFVDGSPVVESIGRALPWTLLLVGTTIVLTFLIGMTTGALAGYRRHKGKGNGLLSGALLLDSIPSFWLGMLLIALFGVTLGLLPTFGVGAGFADPADLASHLVLPVLTLTLTGFGQFFLVTRYSMLAVLAADHIEHARARGIGATRRVFRHALRPALLPAHTVLAIEIGYLAGGALVVETVFAYPGLGRVTFDAIRAKDFPVMQGTFLVLTLTVVLVNALADATYALVDPRTGRAPVTT